MTVLIRPFILSSATQSLLQMDEVLNISDRRQREQFLIHLVNRCPEVDLRLLEAIKMLMMLKAIDLYEAQQMTATGTKVSSAFVWLLYARELTRTPELLFRNRINSLGDSVGLDQVSQIHRLMNWLQLWHARQMFWT